MRDPARLPLRQRPCLERRRRPTPHLPCGRRGEACEAIKGNLADQVGTVAKQAGVRKQLWGVALPSVFLAMAASEGRYAVVIAEI